MALCPVFPHVKQKSVGLGPVELHLVYELNLMELELKPYLKGRKSPAAKLDEAGLAGEAQALLHWFLPFLLLCHCSCLCSTYFLIIVANLSAKYSSTATHAASLLSASLISLYLFFTSFNVSPRSGFTDSGLLFSQELVGLFQRFNSLIIKENLFLITLKSERHFLSFEFL